MNSVEKRLQARFLAEVRAAANRIDKERKTALAPDVVEAMRCIDPKTVPRKKVELRLCVNDTVIQIYLGVEKGVLSFRKH